jgi:hypothetical protein
MELLDLKIGGVTIGTLLGVWGAWYILSGIFKDWREQRALNKEIDVAQRRFKEQHVWQPRMVSGTDCGEWVRKDGQPIRD